MRLACLLGRHKWDARVTRDSDVMTVLCTCVHCGTWWSSSCLSIYGNDFETLHALNWNHRGAEAASIYNRARSLGEIIDLRDAETKR